MYKYFFGIKVGYSREYPGINVAPPMTFIMLRLTLQLSYIEKLKRIFIRAVRQAPGRPALGPCIDAAPHACSIRSARPTHSDSALPHPATLPHVPKSSKHHQHREEETPKRGSRRQEGRYNTRSTLKHPNETFVTYI
jgi:hypothetical protein